MSLHTRQLVVDIPGRAAPAPLDLDLEAGQCWAILGPNGAGKTTLLHTLAGLRAPRSGQIMLDDTPLAAISRRDIARRIGVLFQEHEAAFPATVQEVALTGRHPYLELWQNEREEDFRRVAAALAAMDLAGLERRMNDTLSGGERQRLALATVLVQAPQLYLLDEPTNHLDLHHQVSALRQIQAQIRQGCGAVMALHDINLAARWCDHALLLDANGGVTYGTARDVLTTEKLSVLYQHPVRRIADGDHYVFVPG